MVPILSLVANICNLSLFIKFCRWQTMMSRISLSLNSVTNYGSLSTTVNLGPDNISGRSKGDCSGSWPTKDDDNGHGCSISFNFTTFGALNPSSLMPSPSDPYPSRPPPYPTERDRAEDSLLKVDRSLLGLTPENQKRRFGKIDSENIWTPKFLKFFDFLLFYNFEQESKTKESKTNDIKNCQNLDNLNNFWRNKRKIRYENKRFYNISLFCINFESKRVIFIQNFRAIRHLKRPFMTKNLIFQNKNWSFCHKSGFSILVPTQQVGKPPEILFENWYFRFFMKS